MSSYLINRGVFLFIGPILWGHSGPLCHALSFLSLWTSILHCHPPGVATVARRLRYSYSWLRLILVVVSTVATPGEWQTKIRTRGVRRLAVANGHNIFQTLLVFSLNVRIVAQDQIHEVELEKISLLQENTNLTDQMRQLMIECRVQEQDLNLSRKSVVRTRLSVSLSITLCPQS